MFHCEKCGANMLDGLCRKCSFSGNFKIGDVLMITQEGLKNYDFFTEDDLLKVKRTFSTFSNETPYVFFENCPGCARRVRSYCYGHYLYGREGYEKNLKLPHNFSLVMING